MEVETTERGFRRIDHPTYLKQNEAQSRLIQESSAMDDEGEFSPGSSFLWIGEYHHLNREEVALMIKYMQNWLDTGLLPDKV